MFLMVIADFDTFSWLLTGLGASGGFRVVFNCF